MYSCPGCGGQMTFDIPTQQLKCGRCDRTLSIREADQREARHTGSSFSVDLLTCPTCGAEIRALNAAAAAFCSYCGSSVMLERQDAEITPPEGIIPFRVTREECFAKYQETLKKSLCADHRLRKSVTADSFRGIYVPFHTYRASVQGDAVLKGIQTVGNKTYYYDTKVSLDHRYEGILHDASKEFPDAMSRRISRINHKDIGAFSPAYLSGFYADVPDTSEQLYMDYARTEAVRKGLEDTLADIRDGCTYSTLEAQKELIKVSHAEYTGVTMVPVWFMSMRSGKRILYAVQNACTGEMAADIPMDYPRFGIFALILAIPFFFLLNSFLTLRPEMVMVLSMLLALGAQFVVHTRLKKIADRDAASHPQEEHFDMMGRLKEVNALARRVTTAGRTVSSLVEGAGGILFCFLAVFAVNAMSYVDDVSYFKLGAFALTGIMGILLAVSLAKKRKLPAGSILAFLAMLAGAFILIVNPFKSDDLPVYLVSILCMAAVVWECLDLILLYNRECSSPLPQFESHQGGDDRA